MSNIYQEFVDADCEIDNHESDLYVKADENSKRIIKEASEAGELDRIPNLFRSSMDGEMWYELPFMYKPYWADAKLENAYQRFS